MFREIYNPPRDDIEIAASLKLPQDYGKPTTTRKKFARDPMTYAFATPDDIYDRGSCTFIYNPNNGELYLDKYPVTHDQMLRKNNYQIALAVGLKPPPDMYAKKKIWRPFRDDLMRADIPSGRAGRLYGVPAIGFWTRKVMDKAMVQAIVRMILNKIPSYKDEQVIVFSNDSRGFTPFAIDPQNNVKPPPDLGDISATYKPKPSSSPECDAIAHLDVNGTPVTFGQMLGDLHMVKGERIEAMKAAFCASYEGLRRELLDKGCKFQLDLLDSIKGRVQCSNTAQEYERLKNLGALSYRQDLRKVFDKGAAHAMDPNSLPNEDPVDIEFRGRQKDIDAAFDFLTKKESFAGFKQWLMKEEHEKERRNGGCTRPASHQRDWRRLRTF